MANTYKDNPTKGLSKLQKKILVWLYNEHLKQVQEWEELEPSDSVEILSAEDVKRLENITRIRLADRQPPNLRYTRIEENCSYLIYLRSRPDFHPVYEEPTRRWGVWKHDSAYFSTTVSRLEKRGLVKRFSSTENRTTHLYLTPEGMKYSKQLVQSVPTVSNE